MSLVFKKIESGDIFTRDFNPLVRNNEITFPTSEEIAVIYGPNGTGKTSLIKVLNDAKDTKVEFTLDNTEYQTGAGVFHVINDQNNRNIMLLFLCHDEPPFSLWFHYTHNLSNFNKRIEIFLTKQGLWCIIMIPKNIKGWKIIWTQKPSYLPYSQMRALNRSAKKPEPQKRTSPASFPRPCPCFWQAPTIRPRTRIPPRALQTPLSSTPPTTPPTWVPSSAM